MELPDIRQLKSFVALAETRSFTDAAAKLFRTQSAISHSIKALESLLGDQLVERMGKNVVLTPHLAGTMGHELPRLGRYMVDELDRYLAGKPLKWEITRERAETLA